tara:strand:+ start:1527 stop:1958 length:432 start_codon:yes stop_codon:yes gene_type:complete
MNEALHQIRKKYIDLITGNISIGGNVVPIYNVVPSTQNTPFIRIYSYIQEEVDVNNTNFNTECITRIEPVTSFIGDSGGEYHLNLIIDGILSLIRTRTNIDLSAEGFNVYTTTIDKIRYFEDFKNDETFYRAIIEVSNKVEKI